MFMLLKAGLIVAVFMHMLWERLAHRVCHPGSAAAAARAPVDWRLRRDYTFLTRGRVLRGTHPQTVAPARSILQVTAACANGGQGQQGATT